MKFKADQTAQKLRGGYYTPNKIADYTTKWVLGGSPTSILEPSCGDGAFFKALHNNDCDKNISILGIELFDSEVKKSISLCEELKFTNYSIQEHDFLEWAENHLLNSNKTFDAILGNPPFIRYQFLDKKFQTHTENIFKLLNLKFSKHTNAWVPFVISSVSMLKKGGRIGMVLPSEIINVMHAQSLRTFLGMECSKIVIIDPKDIWFSDTLQGAVILLAEKKKEKNDFSQGVGICSVSGFDFLDIDPETLFKETIAINGETVKGKWTKAVLDSKELELIKKIIKHPEVYPFDEIATVEVGIVTGANDFFLVDENTVKQNSLENYVKPMFGRSQHCQGVIYNKEQHNENTRNGLPVNFIYIPDDFDTLPEKVKSYIKYGESKELNTRYKCRIRSPWYTVPSVYNSKLAMLKRAHDAPRLIFNEFEAYTTDTAYRLASKGIKESKLAYFFLNPLTAIFAELEGRSYGGGVLELVPSEIRKLFIPIPSNIAFDIDTLDDLVRKKSMTEVFKLQCDYIFSSLGFSQEECDILLNIWIKLKNRRQRIDI